MTQTATLSKPLIGRCLDDCSTKEAAIILQGYPVEVLVTARIKGPARAGKILGLEICGKPVSATPILRIVKMVESGEIAVTREEILAVVNQDERSIRFFKQNPWLIDPTGKDSPPAKKGRKPKNLTEPETDVPPQAPPPSSKKREPRPKPVSTPTSTPASGGNQGGPAETPPPRISAEELRELKRQEEENQRRPREQKIERKPAQFRAPSPPTQNATEEEKAAYPALRKQALHDYITEQRSKGWEFPADWDGYGSAAKAAKWVGPD